MLRIYAFKTTDLENKICLNICKLLTVSASSREHLCPEWNLSIVCVWWEVIDPQYVFSPYFNLRIHSHKTPQQHLICQFEAAVPLGKRVFRLFFSHWSTSHRDSDLHRETGAQNREKQQILRCESRNSSDPVTREYLQIFPQKRCHFPEDDAFKETAFVI